MTQDPKRRCGRPQVVVMPPPIPDTPENTALACMTAAPTKAWDYLKPGRDARDARSTNTSRDPALWLTSDIRAVSKARRMTSQRADAVTLRTTSGIPHVPMAKRFGPSPLWTEASARPAVDPRPPRSSEATERALPRHHARQRGQPVLLAEQRRLFVARWSRLRPAQVFSVALESHRGPSPRMCGLAGTRSPTPIPHSLNM